MKKIILFAILFSACALAGQRLPGNVVPEHYILKLTPDLNINRFDGEETINVRVLSPTKSVVLNALNIDIKSAALEWNGVRTDAGVSIDAANERVTLETQAVVPAGVAKIHIRYSGRLNQELRGLYISNANGRKYVVSQFESVDARTAFPSFDEPQYKATFDISVIVDAGDTAISNGQIVTDTPGPAAGKHTIQFSTTSKMSTYLVALAVGDWKCISGEQDGVPLRICSVPGKERQGAFALESTKAVLSFYNRYFGMKYPFGKLDQLAVADFEAGAMENTAAIIYRERDLLLDEKYASIEDRKRVANIVSHEIAHQWFGDLVTMKWWDDLWLNEGFATWIEQKPLAAWKPEWTIPQDESQTTNESLTTDANETTRAIRHPAETREEIDSLFDRIAYGKTASVLRMLESYMSPGVFAAGVNRYLKAHAYGNATAEDFWSAMAAASGQPVDKMIAGFVTQPGAPYVRVRARCDSGVTTAILSQQRFYDAAERMQHPDGQVWQVPVCLRVVGKRSALKCTLLAEKQQEISVAGCGAVFPNAGGAGYYRYSIDAGSIPAMGQLAEAEQTSLAGNASALLRAGQLSVSDYLAVASTMRDAGAHTAVEQLRDDFAFLSSALMTGEERQVFRRWIAEQFGPSLTPVGFRPSATDSPNRRLLRAELLEILGNIGEDEEAISEAKSIVNRFMQDPAASDKTLVKAAIKVAAAHSGEQLYDEFLKRLKNAASAQEYYLYFYALSEFRDPALLRRTLDWTMGPEVRSQDLRLIRSVMENPNGTDIAWTWVRQHADAVEKKAGMGVWGLGFLNYAIGNLCSAEEQDQARVFFERQSKTLRRTQRFQLAKIANCVALRERERRNVATWLKQVEKVSGRH